MKLGGLNWFVLLLGLVGLIGLKIEFGEVLPLGEEGEGLPDGEVGERLDGLYGDLGLVGLDTEGLVKDLGDMNGLENDLADLEVDEIGLVLDIGENLGEVGDNALTEDLGLVGLDLLAPLIL